MLYEEAEWVGTHILKGTNKGFTVANIGSSDLRSRTFVQPHMDQFIFEPLRKNGVKVVHVDIQHAEGVDVVGDLTHPSFINELKTYHFDMLMCCNLLEHLSNRELVMQALSEIVPVEGKLLLTVPYHYPYHLDPIDTMYRPHPKELGAAFPGFEVELSQVRIARSYIRKGDQMVFHRHYFDQLKGQPSLLFRLLVRCLFPFYKPRLWWITLNDLLHAFRPFKVTCLLLRRK